MAAIAFELPAEVDEVARGLEAFARAEILPHVYLRWVATRNPDRYFRGKTSRQKRR